MEASSTDNCQQPAADQGTPHGGHGTSHPRGKTFSPEALASCLADLKRQLALRQAMA